MSAVHDTFAEKLTEPSGAVSIEVAARAVRKKPHTIRQWIRDGMPVEQAGRSGPGNGALVLISTVQLWQAFRSHTDELQDFITDCSADVIDGRIIVNGKTMRIPEVIAKCDTAEQVCSVFALFLCDRAARRITGRSPQRLSYKLRRILTRNMSPDEAEFLETVIRK